MCPGNRVKPNSYTCSANWPGCGRRPGPLQVTVVVAVRREDHRRVFVLLLLVCLQGSREGVELGIAAIGGPVHAGCLGVGFAPNFLHPPVGGGADLAQLLLHGPQDLSALAFALGPELGSYPLALRSW